jgi:acetylornithine/LysW-gamma-L-lysine aminotransferase
LITEEDNLLVNIYQRFPIQVERGKGAVIWDYDGREYIDCMGGYGVGIIGHCNEKVISAIHEQLQKIIICHMSLYNDTRLKFLKKLSDISPKNLSKIFFSNSGSEAVEAALKFARKHTGKNGVISMHGGYHGKTLGSLSVTHNLKYRKSFLPLLDGVKFIPYGDVSNLNQSIDDNTGAIILEPIQGESGIIMPPPDFLQSVREVCDKKNLVLIFDEIQTGLGRTGNMWAGQNWNTTPDIMCIAKGIASGIPMGVTFTSPEIAQSMKVGEHSSTFAGNPLACAAGNATIDVIINEKLVEKASQTGKYFKEHLVDLKNRHNIIREVRGMGMMLALELRFDVRDILISGIKNGLLMLYSGRNIIRLLPPLVMETNAVTRALDILDILLMEEEKKHNV